VAEVTSKSSLRHSLSHVEPASHMPHSAKLSICFIPNLFQPFINLLSIAVRGVASCNSASLRRLLQSWIHSPWQQV
jgi:hypothetical protein